MELVKEADGWLPYFCTDPVRGEPCNEVMCERLETFPRTVSERNARWAKQYRFVSQHRVTFLIASLRRLRSDSGHDAIMVGTSIRNRSHRGGASREVPEDAVAVASEVDQQVDLVFIQPLDGVCKRCLGSSSVAGRGLSMRGGQPSASNAARTNS